MSTISLKAHGTEVTVEGDEDFVISKLDFAIDRIATLTSRVPASPVDGSNEACGNQVYKVESTKPTTAKKKSSQKPLSNSNRPQLLVDLNLQPKDRQSLRDFYKEKKPASALEATTVFVYYLQKILDVGIITLDHLYTCYKEIGRPVPASLNQNVIDTSNRKMTITKATSTDGIKMTVRGENFVEFDLPRKGGSQDA